MIYKEVVSQTRINYSILYYGNPMNHYYNVDKIWNHLFMTRSLGLLSQPLGVP